MSKTTDKMAQMPEPTGVSRIKNCGVRNLTASSILAFHLTGAQYINDMRVLGALAIVAAVVPPPFGFLTAGALVGVYGSGKYLTRHAMRAFRNYKGYAQPGDFEVLGQYNRLADNAYRVIVPLPARIQKTVFPAVEMR